MINGRIHYKWSFSIAMLNYQRVTYIAYVNLPEGTRGADPIGSK
jgi:hypothetical protein